LAKLRAGEKTPTERYYNAGDFELQGKSADFFRFLYFSLERRDVGAGLLGAEIFPFLTPSGKRGNAREKRTETAKRRRALGNPTAVRKNAIF
jgi:hypothetical protein